MSSLDPKHSPAGIQSVRRLNKIPMYIVGSIAVLVLISIFYALYVRNNVSRQNRLETVPKVIENNQVENMLAGIRDGVADPYVSVVVHSIKEEQEPVVDASPVVPIIPPIVEKFEEEDPYLRRIRELQREFRERAYLDALTAGTGVSAKSVQQMNPRSKSSEGSGIDLNSARKALQQHILNPGTTPENMESLLAQHDPNLRLRKDAFGKSSNPYGYQLSTREAPLSDYEIRVGTVIPAILISGINSDLPGEIIAQVSHHVYDSQTGRHVLIPQGSKIIGRYDNHVAMGQERVMIAWHRLQFPDASVLNLGNMGAVDLAGYSGMHDKVNNHTWRLVKNAFLISVIGAGAKISIDGGRSKESNNDPINTTVAEMGRQFGQVGTEMIRRNLQVQPTLEIRPGYQFNIMVNKDLILQPYD